ncbi:MAG: NosD domain-containing protein [Euryarchaeota archaeon]|nr:NosD domain-containing protein [Euryarchaeota archaeon]
MIICAAILFLCFVGTVSAKTWYVDDSGGANFTRIQDAITPASGGDTIIVRDGNYLENVNVNKSLTIQSENGSDLTIVQAANSYDHVFEVTVDYVNISGFTVKGATGGWRKAGIYLGHGVDNCTISNNNCSNNWAGIELQYSNNNKLTGNLMFENGIFIESYFLRYYTQEIDTSNKVNGKPVYYWKDVNGGRIPEGAGQVILVNCTNVIVENQNLNAGSVGIQVAFSSFITIKNNNCSLNNYDGVYLYYSNNTIIMNNNCSSNDDDGIFLYYSNNTIITNNNCSSNDDDGIFLYYSNDNVITNNNCSNNWAGIELLGSNDNKLTGNLMVENGIVIGGSLNEIDTSNTVNGKPVYYWKDVNGGRIPDGAGQVILVNCSNVIVENQKLNDATVGIQVAFSSYITIKNNNCSSNSGDGIYLDGSNNTLITNNNCSNNLNGILLFWDSNDNVITNNNCSNNKNGIYVFWDSDNSITNNNCSNNWAGISLDFSNNNSITNNNCSNNRYGIEFGDSNNNNSIYLNNFMNNTDNVYSIEDSTNIWNSTEKITYTYNGSQYTNYLGNYWDDYKEKYPGAEEIDGCGIWDTPYSINSDNDNYPLMEPWENYLKPIEDEIFDTCAPANPYPSIMGNHTGTIKLNHTVIATKLYTYHCAGTGGHTEYARIWNLTWNATATWGGYVGDWHNISFDKTVVLLVNKTYNYTIRTGSYPQIHHKPELPTANGWINCTEFTDANGKEYNDWIPAIRLW